MIENMLITEDQLSYPTQNTIVTALIFRQTANAPRITDADFTPAYWMGWAAWENVPQSAHISKAELTDEALIFTDVTRTENVDLSYMSDMTSELSPGRRFNNYLILNGNVKYWTDWRSNTNFMAINPIRLYNKLDVNINLFNRFSLSFAASIYTKSSQSWSECAINAEAGVQELLAGSFSISGSVRLWSGVDPKIDSVTITQDDITGHVIERETDTHIIRFCLQNFWIAGFFRSITTSGGVGRYFYPRPVFRVHDEDGAAYLIGLAGGGMAYPQQSWRNGSAVVVGRTGVFTSSREGLIDAPADNDKMIIAGGLSGSLPLDQLQSIAGTAKILEISNTNFAILGTERQEYTRIVRMYDLAEVQRVLGYQCRAGLGDGSAGDDNTYRTDEKKLYPLVVDSQFMGVLINGATDRDRLQPWQIAGEAVTPETNDYKESDKPIYIPPDPDERDKIGDSIGFNRMFPSGSATGLFTLYALRQSHVSQLGAKLWATMSAQDQNFWQNVQFAIGTFAETGSADISSILDYISSIRIYPFALINLPGYTNSGSGSIRLGTGKIPLDLSSGGAGNVGIMGQYTGIIDAGSAYIPAHFEDFRDLEDVSISVYLPYIGNIQLNPAEVTGCTIAAEYAVDLTSGNCVAYLLLSGRWGYYPIGIYSGTIGADIPLSASQGNRLFLRELSMSLGISSIFSNGVFGSAQNSTSDAQFMRSIGGATAAAAAYGINAALSQAAGAALTPPTLGSSANFAGFGAPQTAYLQIRRAQYAYTARSFPAATYGNRTAQRATIGTLSGFTRCINPDVSRIPAPAAIQRSIKAKLEAGVYI